MSDHHSEYLSLADFSGEENDSHQHTDHRHEGDIQKQWSKFTYEEVTALKSKDELVAKVQTKYALDKMQAQKDVDAFAKGRQL